MMSSTLYMPSYSMCRAKNLIGSEWTSGVEQDTCVEWWVMLNHYRCWVTIGAKQRIDVEQDRVTIGAEWDKNPICDEYQQLVSVE